MLLDPDLPALEVDFLELQKPNWRALNGRGVSDGRKRITGFYSGLIENRQMDSRAVTGRKKDWMKTVGKQRDGREGIFIRLSEVPTNELHNLLHTNNLCGIDPYSRKVYYLDDPVHLLGECLSRASTFSWWMWGSGYVKTANVQRILGVSILGVLLLSRLLAFMLAIATHLLCCFFYHLAAASNIVAALASFDKSLHFCDYVLALTVENFLERHLQTLVFNPSMAKSIHHAKLGRWCIVKWLRDEMDSHPEYIPGFLELLTVLPEVIEAFALWLRLKHGIPGSVLSTHPLVLTALSSLNSEFLSEASVNVLLTKSNLMPYPSQGCGLEIEPASHKRTSYWFPLLLESSSMIFRDLSKTLKKADKRTADAVGI
ncbi:uncharacterized protein DS421_6g188130 [Arachis hypogaea]|nr:uncharacterized protein DS421_6g188130 [Arachis hypogaea]